MHKSTHSVIRPTTNQGSTPVSEVAHAQAISSPPDLLEEETFPINLNCGEGVGLEWEKRKCPSFSIHWESLTSFGLICQLIPAPRFHRVRPISIRRFRAEEKKRKLAQVRVRGVRSNRRGNAVRLRLKLL